MSSMNSDKKLSPLARALRGALLALMAFTAPLTHAATIWTGPPITYSQPGTDPTQPANQDRLTPNVWLTRGSIQGLFNANTEAFFTHSLSPADTEWADGTTANFASLSYTDWNSWAKGVHAGPPSTVGVNAVLHLKSEDIYLDIKFTSWPSHGTFAYQRSTPAASLPSPSVSITNPVNNAVFTAPANVTIAAAATVNSGSVTNVAFFGNGAPLGSAQTAPFTITTGSLAAGDYALTAVATAAGISATSSVVNISVVSLPAPTVSITNPVNNAVFTAPANVTIAATAAVSGGSVTNVTFFGNSSSLGSASTAPFTITSGNLAAGNYALTAVATAGGASATSSVVNITVVSPVAISATAPNITNGQFSFDYTANPGLTYVVERSSNLVGWLPIATNVASSNPAHFTDNLIRNSSLFYRVGRRPNP